ncbi:MAG: GNAT family N-acetyltransferase [Oscillospiraceae bacterium]
MEHSIGAGGLPGGGKPDREAFWNVYRPGCTEHLVLHNLRKEACFVPELDYVIEDDGKIIAHIAYAKGSLKTEDGRTETSLLFGPVSVLPEYQGRGYGSKLIQFTLEKARELGYPAVVITGNPAYYSRFGFEPAAKHGIYLHGMDKSQEAPFFWSRFWMRRRRKMFTASMLTPPAMRWTIGLWRNLTGASRQR